MRFKTCFCPPPRACAVYPLRNWTRLLGFACWVIFAHYIPRTWAATNPEPCIGTVAGLVSNTDDSVLLPFSLSSVASVAHDGWGNIYASDFEGSAIAMMTVDGTVSRFAGTGSFYGKYSPNRPADSTYIPEPYGLIISDRDSSGDMYITDALLNAVLRVSGQTGMVDVVAGNVTASGYSDSDVYGVGASLKNPSAVALDSAKNLIIADTYNFLIRKVAASTGRISSIAGNRTFGLEGDGGPATLANIKSVWNLIVDAADNVLFTQANCIRIIWASNGTVDTVVGTGVAGYTGDGGPPRAATVTDPQALVIDAKGNMFIADYNNVIRVVWAATNTIHTLAGTGEEGGGGDGGPATLAQLLYPFGIDVDLNGDVLIADTFNKRIRKVALETGIITTVLATMVAEEGEPRPSIASFTALTTPTGAVILPSGDMVIVAESDHVLWRMTGTNRTMVRFAGNGLNSYAGDGGPATSSGLVYPFAITATSDGEVLFSDVGSSTIRRVNASGYISVEVGSLGSGGYSGDGGPATLARINQVLGIVVDAADNIFFSDSANACVRMINATTRNVTTYAGNCTVRGTSGDDLLATSALLTYPMGLDFDRAGDLYVADFSGNAIRLIFKTNGTIATFPLMVSRPRSVVFDLVRNVMYVSESGQLLIRRVDMATKIVSTVAGTGSNARSGKGDNGPATLADLGAVSGMVVDKSGNLYLCDSENNRVRVVMLGDAVNCPAGFTCACGQPVPCPSAKVICPENALVPLPVTPGFYSTPEHGRVAANGTVKVPWWFLLHRR